MDVIIVIGNDDLLSQGICALIDDEFGHDFKVCHLDVQSSNTLDVQIDEETPDFIVIVAWKSNDFALYELVQRINTRTPRTRIIIVVDEKLNGQRNNLISQNVRGFVNKSSPKEQLIAAIYQAKQGNVYTDPTVITSGRADRINSRLNLLTRTEKKVLTYLAEGLHNKDIAESMCLSTETIKTHVSNILRKLGVRDRHRAADFVQ